MKLISGRSSVSRSPTMLLSLFLLFVFVTQCVAQRSSNAQNAASSAQPASSNDNTPASTSDGNAQSTQAPSSAASAQSESASESAQSPLSVGKISIPGSTSTTSSAASSSAASSSATTTETGSTSIFHLTDLPTVAGALAPTQVVPNTANAPFMRKSDVPEGTVFIIVGAILGFFGVCVLAWRGLVAWSLSRSVKRAARTQAQTFDLKAHTYPAPSAGLYSGGPPPGSSGSMEKLTAVPKTSKRASARPGTSGGGVSSPYTSGVGTRGSMQNLFFSPTAGAGVPSMTPSPRPSSHYLPAGYYAAGSSHTAGGAPTTHINAHANNRGSSLLNPLTDRFSGIRAETMGYQRTNSFGPSPPGSPRLGSAGRASPPNASSVVGQVAGPTGNGLHTAPSASTLNLSVPGGTTQQGGRTPSAYLEDLFENHGSGPRERF